MSLLRQFLRIPAVNRLARATGRLVLPADRFARFDRKLPVVEPFDLRLPNGQVLHWTPQGDPITKYLKYGGWDGYEPESTGLFYELAAHAPVTLDIGAYLGYFGMLAGAAREGARVVAFEPVPTVAAGCRRLFALNPQLNLELVEAVVGRTAGSASLYLSDDPTASDTSTDPGFRPNRRKVDVKSVRIDDIVAEKSLPSVDLAKIDTESTEPEVLAGMADTIRRFRPTMLVEVLGIARVDELNAFLKEFDYVAGWVRKTGVERREVVTPDPTGQELNYLFVPRDPGANAVAAAAHAKMHA